MKWRKFSEKKPANGDSLVIRSEGRREMRTHFQDSRISYSTGTLWLGGNLALDQNYYEWLDQCDDSCPCCGKSK